MISIAARPPRADAGAEGGGTTKVIAGAVAGIVVVAGLGLWTAGKVE